MSRRPRTFTADDVIRLLTVDSPEPRFPQKILSRVSPRVIIDATRSPDSAPVRSILCDVLGFRHEPSAVPVLIDMLEDPDPSVRSAAADALAKIRNPKSGRALEDQFRVELSSEVRSMLAAALGAVGHRHAIPLLIESLSDPWEALRGCAAWSLGHLKASTAAVPLAKALEIEQDAYAKKRMECALAEIRSDLRKRMVRRAARNSSKRRADRSP